MVAAEPIGKLLVRFRQQTLLVTPDVSIVNFETPLVDDAAGIAVAENGFGVCTLANNHVRDIGPTGVASTVAELESLTVVRIEFFRWLMTTALAVLAGETADRRTPEIAEEAQLLLSRSTR